jgi:nucleotide-binding universal stress UspA family protein
MRDKQAAAAPTVLVPIKVLEGQGLPETLTTFLAPADVVVLGYHVLPEQTPAEQASLQFEERAQAAVENVARAFREAGGEAEARVAFTHDRDQTVERVATEVDATAVLLPNPVGEVDDLLVAVRGAIDADRLADVLATLIGAGTQQVTVLGVSTEEADFDAEAAVTDVRERLRTRGVSADRVTTETATVERPVADIVARSAEFDAVVMGESEETLWSLLVGEETERVAEGAIAPVLVVRRSRESTSG